MIVCCCKNLNEEAIKKELKEIGLKGLCQRYKETGCKKCIPYISDMYKKLDK